MRIKVTFIFLLCNSFAANGKSLPKKQFISALMNDGKTMSETRPRAYARNFKTIDAHPRREELRTTLYESDRAAFTDQRFSRERRRSRGTQSDQPENLGSEITKSFRNLEQPSRTYEGFYPLDDAAFSRGVKQKMSQMIMPLLVAYKLKFAALIPILVGGLSLLISTATLAGFFFALFAAVLGLKSH